MLFAVLALVGTCSSFALGLLATAGYLNFDEVDQAVETTPSINMATDELIDLQADINAEIQRRYKTLRRRPGPEDVPPL